MADNYIPLPVAELAVGKDVDSLAGSVVTYEGQALVDLSLLGRPHRQLVESYWEQCLRFWAQLARGEDPGAWIATERRLVEAQQTSKTDLVGEYEALIELGVWGSLIEELCGSEPEFDELVRRAAAANGRLSPGAEGEWVLEFATTDMAGWPDALGGGRSPGEMRRKVTVTVRHAKWRDRRTRRLTSGRVGAEELWPRPPTLIFAPT